MNEPPLLTAEQFAEDRTDLPDGGRWTELVAGEVQTLQPPDIDHGTLVFNLSKELATHFQRYSSEASVYACFELGLIVARNPDTVRYPPVSFFRGADRFANADKTVTESKPALVVEIASTKDRRQQMSRRVREYLDWGVELVWVADPAEQHVYVFRPGKPSKRLARPQSLSGRPVLAGFTVRVEKLFAEPLWWRH